MHIILLEYMIHIFSHIVHIIIIIIIIKHIFILA